jgi:hypothetical protein
MGKLKVHEKFITDFPGAYDGLVIAEYDLDSGNTLEALADDDHGVFWINEFMTSGIMTTRKFDAPEEYDEAIQKLEELGAEMDETWKKNQD